MQLGMGEKKNKIRPQRIATAHKEIFSFFWPIVLACHSSFQPKLVAVFIKNSFINLFYTT